MTAIINIYIITVILSSVCAICLNQCLINKMISIGVEEEFAIELCSPNIYGLLFTIAPIFNVYYTSMNSYMLLISKEKRDWYLMEIIKEIANK